MQRQEWIRKRYLSINGFWILFLKNRLNTILTIWLKLVKYIVGDTDVSCPFIFHLKLFVHVLPHSNKRKPIVHQCRLYCRCARERKWVGIASTVWNLEKFTGCLLLVFFSQVPWSLSIFPCIKYLSPPKYNLLLSSISPYLQVCCPSITYGNCLSWLIVFSKMPSG